MSILALDVGTKKIGVAISKSELISEEYCTIHYQDKKIAVGEIVFLIKKDNIDKIIIGIPKNMDNTDSLQTKFVKDFSKSLQKIILQFKLKTKIYYEDERLTSKEAENILFKKGLSIENVRRRKDQFSAKLILDQYLDSNP